MDSREEMRKSQYRSNDVRNDTKQLDYSLNKIQDQQKLADKLSRIEQLMLKLD